MKAVGYTRAGAIDDDGALVDVELPQPAPGEHNLLAKVQPENVFRRSRLQTVDLAEQGQILRQVGEPVAAEKIRSTLTSTIGAINAVALAQARGLIESGTAVGKVALVGFTSQP